MKQLTENVIFNGGIGDRAVVYYDSVTFKAYYCDTPNRDTLKTQALRRVKRLTYSDGTFNNLTDVELAGGGEFNNVATDITAVESLNYPL